MEHKDSLFLRCLRDVVDSERDPASGRSIRSRNREFKGADELCGAGARYGQRVEGPIAIGHEERFIVQEPRRWILALSRIHVRG